MILLYAGKIYPKVSTNIGQTDRVVENNPYSSTQDQLVMNKGVNLSKSLLSLSGDRNLIDSQGHSPFENQIDQQETKEGGSFNGQGDSNKILQVGSSETTCKITSFDFSEYSKVKPQHIKEFDNNYKRFLEWFIGFTEGNGSFYISQRASIGFNVTKSQDDIQILYKIRTTLGFGKIQIKDEPHRRVGVFYVTGKENFTRLIHLFNGNLCSEYKVKEFEKWVNTYNTCYDQKIFSKQSLNTFTLNDSWLSGFIDAEGYFESRFIPCRTSKQGARPLLSFSISLNSDPEILIKIRDIILSNLKTSIQSLEKIRYKKSEDGYILSTENRICIIIINNYLKAHKLMTKKHIDFVKWSNIQDLMRKDIHQTKEGLNIIKNMISRMYK